MAVKKINKVEPEKTFNKKVVKKETARDIINSVNSDEVDNNVNEVEQESESVDAVEIVKAVETKVAETKKPKVYDQHDLILCRNVCSGWLKMVGKSGIPYVWSNTGDVCEVEYGDLWARKTAKSQYLYEPYIVVEDDELLEQPRWKDLKTFYEDKVYGLDDIDRIISVPTNKLRNVLEELSDGVKRSVAVRATTMVENGTLDSLKKIKIIDEVCGTDILSILPD